MNFETNCSSNRGCIRGNTINGRKKAKYPRFNRRPNVEEFLEKIFLKQRKLFLLEPFLHQIRSFFKLDTSTSNN